MANAEHLEILRSGVIKWDAWRKLNENIKIDLFQANLSGIDLSFANLCFADLSEANLSEANLSEADLSGANLSDANLSKADLSKADLYGANLYGANLSKADLFEADLPKADLSRANLSWADLYGANLSEANLSEANLSEADLSKADLSRANLSWADLSEANLFRANLSWADLSEANLSRADLSEANLSVAILSRANLYGTYLPGANLYGAFLSETNLLLSIIGETIFGLTDLSTCKGLESIIVNSECVIDFHTLRASTNLPKSFLLKLGLPELFIDYLPDFYDDTLTLYSTFLSHSKENRTFARKLYEALIAKRVRVFFDEKELKPGDPLVKTIHMGIKYFDKTILICSEASLNSKWVDYELELAFKKEIVLTEEKGDDVNLLIPITIDDYVFQWNGAKQPEVMGRFVGDFRDWEDETKFQTALDSLIEALNVNRRENKPPSFF